MRTLGSTALEGIKFHKRIVTVFLSPSRADADKKSPPGVLAIMSVLPVGR
jgi:hypothetical protein